MTVNTLAVQRTLASRRDSGIIRAFIVSLFPSTEST
jgi:hypothetical protein